MPSHKQKGGRTLRVWGRVGNRRLVHPAGDHPVLADPRLQMELETGDGLFRGAGATISGKEKSTSSVRQTPSAPS